LDLSKVESGHIELERIPFSLIDCIEESIDLGAPAAEAKGLALAALFAPDTPTEVLGDPVRVRQILVNLVSNAVKFTDRGEVTVGIEVHHATATTFRLGLAVRDTGVGIPA